MRSAIAFTQPSEYSNLGILKRPFENSYRPAQVSMFGKRHDRWEGSSKVDSGIVNKRHRLAAPFGAASVFYSYPQCVQLAVTLAYADRADTDARGYASPWMIVGNVSELAGYCLVGPGVRIAPGRQVFGRVALLNTFLIEEIL
jgi:hypothetical protein